MAVIGVVLGLVIVAVLLGSIIAALFVLIDAFKQSVVDGLLSLLVPFYLIYYLFAKFRHPKKTFITALIMMAPAFLLFSAPLAIFGVRKYLMNAKQAEGKEAVQLIANGIVAYARSGAANNGAELPPSAPPVPASLASVSGMKYMSAPGDWSGTWQLIHFSMSDPQYFQYQWERSNPMQGVVRALADLDGDGTAESHFEANIRCSRGQMGLECQFEGPVLAPK